MILIDGFSSSYLSKKSAPFLYDVAREGFSCQIRPAFAFRGIETTIFTGLWPEKHGTWTEFSLRQNHEFDKYDGNIFLKFIRITDSIPHDRLRLALRYLINEYFARNPFNAASNLIPANMLSHFELSQKKNIFEEKALSNALTLFDVFREKAVPYILMSPPFIMTDKEIIRNTIQMSKNEYKYNFLFMKLSSLDPAGHEHGPNSLAIKEYVEQIDSNIELVLNNIRKVDKGVRLLVLSDHGMSRVDRSIDILSILKELQSRINKDYVVFLDSTIARFWFHNQKAKREISNVLVKINDGHILSEEEKRNLKLPLDKKYGETIFAINEGCVIHPDFFHRLQRVNGMHGYAYTKTDEGTPMLIINKDMTQFSSHDRRPFCFTDIFPLILSSLDLDRSNR